MISTIARTAVVGTVIGAAALMTVSTANAAPRTPWGTSQEIVNAFPELLPASPSSTGYHGASCEALPNPDADTGAKVGITCIDDDSVYLDIYAYNRAAEIDDVLAGIDLGEGNTSTLEDGSSYTSYELQDSSEGAVVFVTFEARDLSKYLMVVAKEGATYEEIATIWGADAPIVASDVA